MINLSEDDILLLRHWIRIKRMLKKGKNYAFQMERKPQK